MDLKNMKLFRSQMAALPDSDFAMGYWITDTTARAELEDTEPPHDCKTVACGAGWCSILNGGPTTYDPFAQRPSRDKHPFHWSCEFLGLSEREGRYLFYGNWANEKEDAEDAPVREDITRVMFVEELDRMIAKAVCFKATEGAE